VGRSVVYLFTYLFGTNFQNRLKVALSVSMETYGMSNVFQ